MMRVESARSVEVQSPNLEKIRSIVRCYCIGVKHSYRASCDEEEVLECMRRTNFGSVDYCSLDTSVVPFSSRG